MMLKNHKKYMDQESDGNSIACKTVSRILGKIYSRLLTMGCIFYSRYSCIKSDRLKA